MSLPQSLNVEGKDIALYTFKQLEQKPRLTLKNLAMNLRDAIGQERLPPLRAASGVEEVISWIIDVQCMLAGATGIQLTPRELGVPSDYAMAEAGLMGGGFQAQPQAQAPRAEMPYPDYDAAPQVIPHAAMAEAAQTKARNQRGSNIFGGDDERSPRGYPQQQQPKQQFGQADPNEAAARAAYEAAMDQAAATRARNQRGSAIFG